MIKLILQNETIVITCTLRRTVFCKMSTLKLYQSILFQFLLIHYMTKKKNKHQKVRGEQVNASLLRENVKISKGSQTVKLLNKS